MTDKATENPEANPGSAPLDGWVRPGAQARWYCLSRDGLATLCADEQDARMVAQHSAVAYPLGAPYRAVLLGDVAAERERCAQLCEQWDATRPARLAAEIRRA